MRINVLICLALGVSACSATSTGSISRDKLATGAMVRVGMVSPDSDWDCQQLTEQAWDWDQVTEKSEINSYGAFNDLAVEYANKMHLYPNYIYLNLPSHISTDEGQTATILPQAVAVYYRCQHFTH